MASAELLSLRARLLRLIRDFFTEHGYVEVETPALAPSLIPEPTIEVFGTRTLDGTALYLTPSPERWMKRLVAGGHERIFQIARGYRNGEDHGPYHALEFALLEWYSGGHGYMDEIAVVEELLGRMAADPAVPTSNRYVDRIDLPCIRLSMAEACSRYAGFDLRAAQDLGVLRTEAARLDVHSAGDDSWEELFHRVFLAHVEPHLPSTAPVVLYDYPAAIATLAQTDATGISRRWELYAGKVELANCFEEEADPANLSRWFRREARRAQDARTPRAVDWALARKYAGTQRTAGVALGLDRLLMVMLDGESLDDVLAFPRACIAEDDLAVDDG